MRLNDYIVVQLIDDEELVILDESTMDEILIPLALLGRFISVLEFFERHHPPQGIMRRVSDVPSPPKEE